MSSLRLPRQGGGVTNAKRVTLDSFEKISGEDAKHSRKGKETLNVNDIPSPSQRSARPKTAMPRKLDHFGVFNTTNSHPDFPRERDHDEGKPQTLSLSTRSSPIPQQAMSSREVFRTPRSVQRSLARPMSAPSSIKRAQIEVSGIPDGIVGKATSRPGTSGSSDLQNRLSKFQAVFQNKNAAKFSLMSKAFRSVDADKNGILGRSEIVQMMQSLDIPAEEKIVDRLMSKCSSSVGMTIQDFRNLLWVDETVGCYIDDRLNKRGDVRGDNDNQKYLWTPAPSVGKYIGSINDTLEADKRDEGNVHPRIDFNFSSVRYDILSFNRPKGEENLSIKLPVKKRPALFDNPMPVGRRVAYDRGDTPWNLISLKLKPDPSIPQNSQKDDSFIQAPIRLFTFASEVQCKLGRSLPDCLVDTGIQNGEFPTQNGLKLTSTTY
mmetsp:Transcript_9657/g.21986  ORF Transcript_9657/g.21986 Transcript_9657/m.21986 type:complete len:434 (-) Transcript_9657:88-1389(-)